jgi:tetratricopeptide (TPR) repeat protein
MTLSMDSRFDRSIASRKDRATSVATLARSAACLLLCCVTVEAYAQDTIQLKQGDSDAVITVTGTIEEFTGRFIRYRTTTAVREAPTSSVSGIRHDFSDVFEQGKRLFDAGQFPEAEVLWKQALSAEPKPWVRREIRSWLIRAAWRQDHWADAGEQFLAIAGEDPQTIHWPLAPLVWTPLSIREPDRLRAREWLEQRTSLARLLGASLLLKDSTASESATRVLNDLLRDSSSQIAHLARAQLWRNRLTQALSDGEIGNWQSHVSHLPRDLRSGPQYLVGSAYLRRGQYDRAAAEFLWVPLMFPQHEPTAARASLEAGECLLRAARQDEARRVLNETIEKYQWSPAAADARSRLEQLAN